MVVVLAIFAQALVIWRRGARVSLILGYTFLYLPILALIVLSFNANERSSVWGGFTTEFYVELFGPKARDLRTAAWTSVRVGLVASSLGVILGVMAALVLVRIRRFWGGKYLGA